MQIVKTIDQLQNILCQASQKGKTIGFVPTMGSFHEGHLNLMRHAKKKCDLCVVSIFINPKQFGPKEDLKSYPRNFTEDASLCLKENVDILFFPTDNEIYPNRYLTYIDVENISNVLCGAFRPGHFKGVATVVAKLLNIVQPDVMFLGQKDAQQVAIIKEMVCNLNFPVDIQVVPTTRAKDGLALSSRNAYLSPQERQEAVVLYKALRNAQIAIKAGERSSVKIVRGIKAQIAKESHGKIQYVECVNVDTLEPLTRLNGKVLIALAVFFGKTRLIDNVITPINDKKEDKN